MYWQRMRTEKIFSLCLYTYIVVDTIDESGHVRFLSVRDLFPGIELEFDKYW